VRRAALVILVLLAPPVRHALEATMTAQMLVQLPLLVVAGWLLSRAFPPRVLAKVERWNHRGITGLVLATVTAAFWMLPRSLDAATSHPLIAAAKYLSVPLRLGGYMLALGGGLLVWLAWRLLWGRFESYSSTHVHSSPIPQQ